MLSLSTFNRLYAESSLDDDGGAAQSGNYFRKVLEVLNIEYTLSDEDRAKIPTSGPVVVVANHPFGGADGVVLGDLLTGVRVRRAPAGQPAAGQRDPAARPGHRRRRVRRAGDAIRAQHRPAEGLRALAEAGRACWGCSPPGTVSHLKVRDACITDPAWHPNVAALVRRTGATVVPVFFEGRNSMMFQLAGLVHPGLRTALLPKELLKRSHSQAVGVRGPAHRRRQARAATRTTRR